MLSLGNHFYLVAGILLLPIHAAPQPAAQSTVDVESLMTAAEFRQAGLNKLSAQEMSALNRWLGRYSMQMLMAGSGARTPDAPAPGAIESQIEGTFNGWNGDTIFELTNGQIWQQAAYAYTYHYAYRPDVLIYKSGGGYKMKVDGVDDAIAVKRIK